MNIVSKDFSILNSVNSSTICLLSGDFVKLSSCKAVRYFWRLKVNNNVFISAGIELISFTEAHMTLWFGFFMKTAVITLTLFLLQSSAYPEPRTYLCLVLPCLRGAGGVRGAGRGHSWHGLIGGQSVPPDIMLSNKTGGGDEKGERGEHLEGWHLSSQKNITYDKPCFPESGWTSACRWEEANELLVLPLLACTAFAFT